MMRSWCGVIHVKTQEKTLVALGQVANQLSTEWALEMLVEMEDMWGRGDRCQC